MTVMGCYIGNELYQAKDGDPELYSRELSNEVSSKASNLFMELSQGVLWNSTARIEQDKITNEFHLLGNVTEMGMIKFFVNVQTYQGCIDLKRQLEEENILQVISFSSKRKRASIVVRNPKEEGTDKEVRVYTKGAPDMMFNKVMGMRDGEGEIEDIDE